MSKSGKGGKGPLKEPIPTRGGGGPPPKPSAPAPTKGAIRGPGPKKSGAR